MGVLEQCCRAQLRFSNKDIQGLDSRPRLFRFDVPHIRGLGQNVVAIRVMVSDRRGEPGEGIGVVVVAPDKGNVGEGTTDSDGIVTVRPTSASPTYDVIATLPEGEARRRISVAPGLNVVSFVSTMKINGPIVTTAEGATIGGGIGLVLGGIIMHRNVESVVGDVMIGLGSAISTAGVIATINRHL